MHDAGVRLRVIHRHVRLAAPVAEARHGSELVVADDGVVGALRIDRPRIDIGEAVRRRVRHRIDDPAVVVHLHTGVRPPVEAMPRVAAVVERRVLLERGGGGLHPQLNAPRHAVRSVDVADPRRRAAIRVRRRREIHRRRRHPVVRHGKVELDAERRPRAAIRDLRELDRRVRVEHLPVVDLVGAAIQMPAEVRQHHALQVRVLEIERAPRVRRALARRVHPQRVRVVVARRCGKQIERRIGIRQAFLVRRQRQRVLPHAHTGRRGQHGLRTGGNCGDGDQQGEADGPMTSAHSPYNHPATWLRIHTKPIFSTTSRGRRR